MRKGYLKIQELSEVFDGPHATPTKTEEGPFYLSISSLKNGTLDLSQSARLSELDFLKWTKRVTPKKGDLLFSYETRLGEAALMPDGIKACLGRRMGIVRPDPKRVLPEYLLYSYLAPEFQSVIASNTITGATVDRLSLTDFPTFEMRVPPIEQQRRVASVLSALDAKISLNNRINKQLEEMAKLLYDYWFVQFDFPITAAQAAAMGKPKLEGKPYRASGGKMTYNEALKREIPEEWDGRKLEEFEKNIITGKTPSTLVPEYHGGDIPFICIGDVRGNMHVVETELTLSKLGADSQRNKYIPKGAICVTCIASPGLIAFASEDSQTNQQLNSVICEMEEHRYFLYFELKQHFRFSSGAKTGNTFSNMNKGDFSAIPVLVPPDDILRKFHELVSPNISLALVNSLQNKELTELRDWLLPMLMNGQVTVS